KANVKINPCYNFDLLYITDPKTDIYLPSLHPAFKGNAFQYIDRKKVLTGSEEQAFVAYGRAKFDKLIVEPYYMYKTEQPVAGGVEATKLKLNTIGARVAYSVDAWNMGAEYAHQFGDYDSGKDRTGNGGYVYVGRKYEPVMWKPEWELRYVYLSGDKADTTGKIETWNPLFSRNPYWNELFIYTLVTENAKFGGGIPGYWSNLQLLKASVKLNFSPATNLALSYQHLWAPESTSGLSAAMFSNSGTDRGHLPTAMLSHKFSKSVDAYLQLEYFIPGDFYNKDKTDNATFFRWQVQIKI
ncbi:MAG TPA: alginate export family protein, partial [Thermodesulfovibrionales bacterium]|nr:alginate export family protein [Thermodesulfovibrionales bacterium]